MSFSARKRFLNYLHLGAFISKYWFFLFMIIKMLLIYLLAYHYCRAETLCLHISSFLFFAINHYCWSPSDSEDMIHLMKHFQLIASPIDYINLSHFLNLLFKMTCEGKRSKERQSELWLTVWGVEQAQLQSGAGKDTGLRWLTAQVSKQPRDGLCVFLYERSRMLYLRVWISTVKITEMLNASVLWMKTCVCVCVSNGIVSQHMCGQQEKKTAVW